MRSSPEIMDVAAHGARVCPGCGTQRLRRSPTRGLERLLKPFTPKRPYSCSLCGWRGWRRSESESAASRAQASSLRMLDVIDAPTTTTIRSAPADPLSESVASQLGNLAQTLMAHPGRLRTLALVGCGRGEGTSTLTANLGRYLATHRARVLMVDANAHAPALHAISGAHRAGGLSELMDGRIALDAAVKATAVPDLFVLTAGERLAAGNGLLLASDLRDRLLTCATAAYDFVLLDCPCVNVYEDTASLAAQCDGVILVVEGGRTLRQSARSAKQLLARANCNLLGVFMNKRQFPIPRFLYERL